MLVPDDVWREVAKCSIKNHYEEFEKKKNYSELVKQVFSLESVCRVFKEGVNQFTIQWSLVKRFDDKSTNPITNNRKIKSILYCEMMKEVLKDRMILFIKEEKLTYRSQKTNRVLIINKSMKKIKTLPKKITTIPKRDYLTNLIKDYERLNSNYRKMHGY